MVKIKDIISYLKHGQETIEHTVDELLFGDEEQSVCKVATTFIASVDVIKQAIEDGIEFIISHEGIYYLHRGIPEGLQQQAIFNQKNELITSHQLAIFRYHDYMHHCFPDPITAALVEQLRWQQEQVEHQPYSAVVTLSTPKTVEAIIAHIKDALMLPTVRLTGNMLQSVTKIGLLVGYRGGTANSVNLIQQYDLDLLIVGEAQEWETAEYIADCNALGYSKSMLTIGHMPSEAYGMKLLSDQLQLQFPQLNVTFLANKSCYQTL